MHSAVLPADRRLTDSADFVAATRGGRRSSGRTLVVHARLARLEGSTGPSGSVGSSGRVGLVVSKQVGGAVVRNRVKRRLRHQLRDLLPLVPDEAVVVVRALPPAATASSEELGRELTRCLGRATSEVRR